MDLELWSVDRTRNRFRVYGLREDRTLFGEPCLCIAWGRLGRPLRERTEAFASRHALEARRRAIVDERERHGYFAPSLLGPARGALFGVSVLAATGRPAARPPSPVGDAQLSLPFERAAA
jgi:predicted DNA-binding WGR domain protein